MYQLRTIDIWDTLLRRDCHPECIKLATAQHLYLGWCDKIHPEYRDGWYLYRERIAMESRLADQRRQEGKDDEYEIIHVMQLWLDHVLPHAPANLAIELAEFELQTEMKRAFPDPEIEDTLKQYPAERTLFLSDFYIGKAMLSRLLADKGLDRLVADGLVSCDVGLNKRSGMLFEHVQGQYAVTAATHVHIGDNAWSDVSAPKKLGIHAVHFLPAKGHQKRLHYEGLFASREALYDHVQKECHDLAEVAAKTLEGRQAAAFRLGAEAALLFVGFGLWVAEKALTRKIDHLYFFTREGEFFQQVYATLFPERKLHGYVLPPDHVLAVSRLATFAASMQDVSIEEMSRIWSLFKIQSVSGLFVTLGLDVADFAQELEEAQLKSTDVIDNPVAHPGMRQLFSAPTFIHAAKEVIASQRNLLQGYLQQNSVISGLNVGGVDIGWRGTIQDNLAMILPDVQWHGLYLGLRKVINQQPENVTKSAYGPDENTSLECASLFENFAVLEMLCNSVNGSVVGYKKVNEHIAPDREVVASEIAGFEDFTRYFQEGVLLAAQHWQSYLERYVVTSDELRPVAMHIWERLRSAPGKDLAETFMQTPQHDVFGFGDIFRRDQVPSLSTILLSPVSQARRQTLLAFIRRVQWSAAIHHAQGIGYFHRKALLLTFKMANMAKQLRNHLRSHKKKRSE